MARNMPELLQYWTDFLFPLLASMEGMWGRAACLFSFGERIDILINIIPVVLTLHGNFQLNPVFPELHLTDSVSLSIQEKWQGPVGQDPHSYRNTGGVLLSRGAYSRPTIPDVVRLQFPSASCSPQQLTMFHIGEGCARISVSIARFYFILFLTSENS